MQDRLIEMGTIVAPQGIKGEMKMNPLCAPEQLKNYTRFYDKDGQQLALTVKRIQKNQVIVTLDNVRDRNQAENMRGLDVFVKRSDLPNLKDEDTYYICDLLNLNVFENGQKIGTISGIENYGASDVMQVTLSDGKFKLIAMSKQTIKKIDFEKGQIDVCVPDEIDAEDKDAL